MMDDYRNHIHKSLEYRKIREDKYKEAAKDKLLNAAKKKIQTTMIGSLSSIESYLGFLLDSKLSEAESQELKNIFENLRSEILDRGNTQIRNLENEFSNYDIYFRKFTLNLPFRGNKDV